jgi:hypothetical protein
VGEHDERTRVRRPTGARREQNKNQDDRQNAGCA